MFSEANSRKVEKKRAISALLLLLPAYGKRPLVPGFQVCPRTIRSSNSFARLPELMVGFRTIRWLELAGNPGVELAAADPIFPPFNGGQQPERRC
jgi:hypothetical protein